LDSRISPGNTDLLHDYFIFSTYFEIFFRILEKRQNAHNVRFVLNVGIGRRGILRNIFPLLLKMNSGWVKMENKRK